MGQAFDRDGNVLGEATGATKAEVFETLNREHADAAEIRIKQAIAQHDIAARDQADGATGETAGGSVEEETTGAPV